MIDEAAAVPLILAAIQAIKKGTGLPGKYSSLVAIALGIAYALLIKGPTIENGLIGLAIGLSASGLYSGGKALVK